jgi:hypothetical protein
MLPFRSGCAVDHGGVCDNYAAFAAGAYASAFGSYINSSLFCGFKHGYAWLESYSLAFWLKTNFNSFFHPCYLILFN